MAGHATTATTSVGHDAPGAAESAAEQCTPRQGVGQEPLRIGMLVIHGIGQQQRYQTLAEVTWALLGQWGLRGLLTFLSQQAGPQRAAPGCRYRIEPYTHRGFTDLKVIVELGPHPSSGRPVELCMHELYWAPLLNGSVRLWSMLLWMAQAVLAPLRNVTQLKRGLGSVMEVWRYVLLIAVYLAVLALLLGLLLGAAACILHLGAVYSEIARLLSVFAWQPFVRHGLQLAAGLAGLGGLTVSLPALLLEMAGPRRRLKLLGLAAVQLPLLALTILGTLGAVLSGWWPLIVLVLIGCAYSLLRRIIVDWVGDVAAYTAASETASTYAQRKQVLRYAVERLEYLSSIDVAARPEQGFDSRRESYDALVVVGHSLGSVIAYEALCAFWARIEELDGQDGAGRCAGFLDKHRLLITLGSPLDKLPYFFGSAAASNVVYGQLVGHGRVTCDKPRRAGELFANTRLINLWCASDVISGPLDLYGSGLDNVHLDSMLWRQPPLINHVQYFANRDVGALLLKELLGCGR